MTKRTAVYETRGAAVYDDNGAVSVRFVGAVDDTVVATVHGHEFDLAMAKTLADGAGPCVNCGNATVEGGLAPPPPEGLRVPGL